MRPQGPQDCQKKHHYPLNTQNMRNSNFVYVLPKMEYVHKEKYIWPENDGEKWSRKNYFEIPTCASHFLLNEFTS